jgi:hypothetical protein
LILRRTAETHPGDPQPFIKGINVVNRKAYVVDTRRIAEETKLALNWRRIGLPRGEI